MLKFNIVSLFPDFFQSPLAAGLLGKAVEAGLVSFQFQNPRDFAHNRHHHVDDQPFGGGPGMVMQVGPVLEAVEGLANPGEILLLSPAGEELTGPLCAKLATKSAITLICGRYEGIDARLKEFISCREIRFGRAILNGGETAALAVIEAVCRFLPGFLSDRESLREESFAAGLLEYPQYTRPAEFRGHNVPEVILNGNHALIKRWRRDAALAKTLAVEPGELEKCLLSREDVDALSQAQRKILGKNLSFCLFHYPVRLDAGLVGTSSLTNLDIHDIARISQSYGLGPFFVLTPLPQQRLLLQGLLAHWLKGKGAQSNPDRKKALEKVIPVASSGELERRAIEYYGKKPLFILTSAAWPRKRRDNFLTVPQARELLESQPAIICLGTARGLIPRLLDFEYSWLRPLRFLDDNHLSVRAAAAIIADRILGDFY